MVFLALALWLNWFAYLGSRGLDDRYTGGPLIKIVFVPILTLYLVYYVAVRIHEFTRMVTYVKIDTDTGILQMRNLWKKEVEVMARSIKSIQPVRPWPLTSGWKHLALVDESGYKHIIHHNVEPLGECMEAIRKLCPNLQKVDYGGLDKHGLWTIRGKM